MSEKNPNLLQMVRAPFFTSILSPLLAGTFLALLTGAPFQLLNFILVIIMGVALHAATNVYNDIYDTLQGTDTINEHRNDFSGGSGLIVENPDLMPRMFRVARASLVIALLAAAGLSFLISPEHLPQLWILYLLSAFFAKFYTAAPVKLAYRGLGEFSVWFAFGPMAILFGAVGQDMGLHPFVTLALPTTGISTLSILTVGQMIDHDADKAAGKLGIAPRHGNNAARYLYITVQFILVLNILVLSLAVLPDGWFVLLALIPYITIFPKILQVLKNYNNPESLKVAAGLNVQVHMLFSVLFNIGLLLAVIL